MDSEKPPQVLATASDNFLAVGFNADGSALAAGAADNTIRIVDFASRQETRKIEQHADWVLSVAFSHDGSRIVTASRDKSARLFDAKTGELEYSYLGHTDPVFSAAFADNDKQVYSAGRDRKIFGWDPTVGDSGTGKKKSARKPGEIGGFEGDIIQLLVRGDWLFSCSADHNVRLHSVENRELIRTFAGHKDVVYSLAYDEKNKRLASGGYDGEVRIWKVDDGSTLTAFVAAPGYHGAKAQAAAK